MRLEDNVVFSENAVEDPVSKVIQSYNLFLRINGITLSSYIGSSRTKKYRKYVFRSKEAATIFFLKYS